MVKVGSFPRLALVAAFAVLPLGAADPGLMKLVMPDAQVVMGFDVDRIKGTPFGQFLLSQVKEEGKDFREFLSMTGFDPRRDLREVVIAARQQPHVKAADEKLRHPRMDGAIVGVRGIFDQPKLLALLQTKGGRLTSYRGVNLVLNEDQKDTALAFLDGALLVVGKPAEVQAAIDRYLAGTAASQPLAGRAQAASGRYDAWLVTDATPARLAPKIEDPQFEGMMKGAVLQGVEDLMAGVRFGALVEFSGEMTMRSEKDALALADVARFFMNLAQGNQNVKGPALQMLQSLQLDARGNMFRFSFSAPEADLEKIFTSRGSKGKAEVI